MGETIEAVTNLVGKPEVKRKFGETGVHEEYHSNDHSASIKDGKFLD
jgi:hypothetical protein